MAPGCSEPRPPRRPRSTPTPPTAPLPFDTPDGDQQQQQQQQHLAACCTEKTPSGALLVLLCQISASPPRANEWVPPPLRYPSAMPSATTVHTQLPSGFVPASLHLPTQQTAVVQIQHDNPLQRHSIRHDVPLTVSHIEPHQLLVKNLAVAINPCDWKMPTKFPSPGARVGCDLYGIVLAIGPQAAKMRPDIKLGDKVAGAIHGSNPIDHASGSFAEYVNAHADLVSRIPPALYSDIEGAAIGGTAFSTLRLALWDSLGLTGTPSEPLPATAPKIPVLIYGGSTATGTMALQLAKMSGYSPIATCSPRNFDLCKQYGADAVFDYNNKSCGEEIKAYTKNALKHVLDVITDGTSQIICHKALGRSGGVYTALELPSDEMNTRKRTVKLDMVVGLCALGKEVALAEGYEREANPLWREHVGDFFGKMQPFIDSGSLRPHPQKRLQDGFEGILKGVDMLRNRQTSGEKLIVFL